MILFFFIDLEIVEVWLEVYKFFRDVWFNELEFVLIKKEEKLVCYELCFYFVYIVFYFDIMLVVSVLYNLINI